MRCRPVRCNAGVMSRILRTSNLSRVFLRTRISMLLCMMCQPAMPHVLSQSHLLTQLAHTTSFFE